jgi:hypothetical protein
MEICMSRCAVELPWSHCLCHLPEQGLGQLWVQFLEFDAVSAVVSRFIGLSGLAPSVCHQLDSWRPIRTCGCSELMQGLPETRCSRLSREQSEKSRASRGVR